METALAVIAIVVSVVAIVVSLVAIRFAVVFFKRQTEQGERIGMSVMSTVDQIYRKMRDGGAEEA